jgi:hypothetical protein
LIGGSVFRGLAEAYLMAKVEASERVERVTLSRALSWKRRRAYHRMTRTGELVLVQAIKREGRHYRLILANGRSFLVDRDHVLYAPPKDQQTRLF